MHTWGSSINSTKNSENFQTGANGREIYWKGFWKIGKLRSKEKQIYENILVVSGKT